ncbi:DapH/DapD/GlmU-related protein [Arthrobacter sp. CJ23]|uniref:acyltransferase n=1 Tax=Arthrobacter sp. CJ23 TaxID=2972479 RepID=UPI00215BFC4D|nr:acyltransferase [Arthrobacter sp. CJ23]UVJ41243.1 acyltransferase [Arthrobacter sp. CJ23]
MKFDYSPWLFWPGASGEERESQLGHQDALKQLDGVTIGSNVFLSPLAMIDPTRFSIGSGSYVAAHAYITDTVDLGDNTTVNAFTVVRGKVSIGNAVRIGAHTSILGFNHSMDPSEPVYKQPHTSKGILIGDDVWIGSNVVIVDGVTIGSHAVLAAGAVVTRDVPDWSIAGGNPARHIRDRRDTGRKDGAGAETLAQTLADFAGAARAEAPMLLGRSWDPDASGGRYVDQPGAAPTVRAHCDAIEIADLLLGAPPAQLSLSAHIDRLQGLQDPASGLVGQYASDGRPDRGPLDFGTGDAAYHVLSVGYALDLLGSRFRHPIHAVASMGPEELAAAVEALPWRKEPWASGAWIDAWGTATYWNLAQGVSTATTPLNTLFGWLLVSASTATGTWGQPSTDMRLKVVNGYYRLTRGTFAQFGVPVPHADALIDTVLGHAADPRYFASGRPNACNVLDVAHPLWLARKQSNHRQADVQIWARLQLDAAMAQWIPGAGLPFSFSPTSAAGRPSLQGTEMWLAIIWYLADLLGEAEALGYRPRGVHRPEPAFSLPTL